MSIRQVSLQLPPPPLLLQASSAAVAIGKFTD